MIGKYNEKRDLWSTGVLVYYMLTGEFPFDDETDEGLEYKIKTQEFDCKPLEFSP